MRDDFVENFVTLSRSIDKSVLNSDPDGDDILGEYNVEKTKVDAREWYRTKVANRSIANETGRTFMRRWRVLSETL